MPIYNYRCKTCEIDFEGFSTLKDWDKPKECETCGNLCPRVTTAVNLNFPGDSWISKNLRIERQMRRKNQRLAKKEYDQKKSGTIPSLLPNVDGERFDSWSEAKTVASERGKDTTQYDVQIRKSSE